MLEPNPYGTVDRVPLDTCGQRQLPTPWLSIVVPALDEAAALRARADAIHALHATGVELLLVDGGSSDDTLAVAAQLFDAVLQAPRGRARQMNAGANVANGEWLAFLHADTRLSERCLAVLRDAVQAPGARWGRFDVRLSDTRPSLRLVATMMNLRSRCTGIATGDQCMFVRAADFQRVGGFPDQPLMEDIELSARLRRMARPVCLRPPVETDARRWLRHGVARTIVLMWSLRLAYWCGVPANRIARWYARR